MSNVLPELIYPFSDTFQLGTDYYNETIDANEDVFATIPTDTNTAVSIYARVTMKSLDNAHFAQFEMSSVFLNNNGVMTEKNRSDTVQNRDNDGNYFRFNISGTDIQIVAKSNLAQKCFWSGVVAVIPI